MRSKAALEGVSWGQRSGRPVGPPGCRAEDYSTILERACVFTQPATSADLRTAHGIDVCAPFRIEILDAKGPVPPGNLHNVQRGQDFGGRRGTVVIKFHFAYGAKPHRPNADSDVGQADKSRGYGDQNNPTHHFGSPDRRLSRPLMPLSRPAPDRGCVRTWFWPTRQIGEPYERTGTDGVQTRSAVISPPTPKIWIIRFML